MKKYLPKERIRNILSIFCLALLIVFNIKWILQQYQSERDFITQSLELKYSQLTNNASVEQLKSVLESLEKFKGNDSLLAASSIAFDLNYVTVIDSNDLLMDTFKKAYENQIYKALTDTNKKISTKEMLTTLSDQVKLAMSSAGEQMTTVFREEKYDSTIFAEFKTIIEKDGYKAVLDTVKEQEGLILFQSDVIKSESKLGIIVENYKGKVIKALLPTILFSLFILGGIIWVIYSLNKSKNEQIRFNNDKDIFISNMSHELKTPIATSKIVVESLQTEEIFNDVEMRKEYLHIAGEELTRLEKMVESIMNLMTGTKKNVEIKKKYTYIYNYMNDLFEKWRIIYNNESIGIIIAYNINKTATFYIDQLHISNAIENILENAKKYGAKNVTVNINNDSKFCYISIANDGPIILEEHRKKIFDQFFRITKENVHNVKGYGIGLSYSKQIIEMHNGTIYLDKSEQTNFIIKLPIEKS